MQPSVLKNRAGLAALGIRPPDAAHVLATLIDRSPLPVTALVGGIADTEFRITVTRTGTRGLSVSEAHLLDAQEGAPCRWRTGRLETADGELAAGVFLLWLPRSRARPRSGRRGGTRRTRRTGCRRGSTGTAAYSWRHDRRRSRAGLGLPGSGL